jgi:hypothetical protein
LAEKEKNPVRITNQFRSRTGFVYDLTCESVRLTVDIMPRGNQDDAGDFRVEAKSNAAPDAEPVFAWAMTRIDALRSVGTQWSEKGPEAGLPALDWDAVATALAAVRAV